MSGVHSTVVLARFRNGSLITTLNLGILGSNGLRNVIGISIRGYGIKVPGNRDIPTVVFLTTNVVGLFPNQCNRFGPTFECIPVTLYPTIVDGNGDTICSFSSSLIHVPSKEISYHNSSRNVIDIPNEFKMGLGLYSDSSFPAAVAAPPEWPCSKVLDVAGDDSTVVFEFVLSHEGQKQSFPEKFSIGYGHTSNI